MKKFKHNAGLCERQVVHCFKFETAAVNYTTDYFMIVTVPERTAFFTSVTRGLLN